MGAGFTTEQIGGFRQAYGGRMADKEVEFLRSLQSFIDDAIRDGLGFAPVVKILRQNLRGLRHHRLNVDDALRFDLDAAIAAGEIAVPSADQLKALHQMDGGPMSEREVEFLRDVQGIIDYMIRNDLGLTFALATVGHDVNGLTQYDFRLDAADADGFLPKVAGFAGSQADSVGAPEDADE